MESSRTRARTRIPCTGRRFLTTAPPGKSSKSFCSFVFVWFFFGCATPHAGSWFLDQGSSTRSLQWKHGVLTTGLPGKSLSAPRDFKFLRDWLRGRTEEGWTEAIRGAEGRLGAGTRNPAFLPRPGNPRQQFYPTARGRCRTRDGGVALVIPQAFLTASTSLCFSPLYSGS